ncbi:hypothetical protein FACS1894218_0360 [Bacilli bacterium]|nr:hypothetical protein FACS1894218_0360 [Bacilli bacterium]
MNEFKKMGLNPIMDQFHNILVRKPATEGLEKKSVVVLQAHMDMVAAKDASSKHNFAKDPIELIIEDD